MKGFLLTVCLFCICVTIAYFLKKYCESKIPKVAPKKESKKLDLPFKNSVVKIKKKP